MKNLLMVAYDLVERKDDNDRAGIREQILEYCGKSAPLSESCYVFKSDKPKDEVFADLKKYLSNKGDKLTVAYFDEDAIIYSDNIKDVFDFFGTLNRGILTADNSN